MAGKCRIVVVFLLSLCVAAMINVPVGAAQEPEFRVEMDSLQLQVGVSTRMVISLVNASGANIVSVNGLEYFEVLSQSQSESTTIANNETRTQIDLHVSLMPQAMGTFSMSVIIEYEGQMYETNTLEVTIGEEAVDTTDSAPELFVETLVSHEEAFLGEKVIVTYNLYTRVDIEGINFPGYLTIDGGVSKELANHQILNESVYIDGFRYMKYEVRQVIVDPIQAGVCTIPSIELQVSVFGEDTSGFGGMFRSTELRSFQTDAKSLLVKPLPSEGRPAGFTGIVGVLELEGHYSREELDYGESLALEITAAGSCNLDGLKNIVSGSLPGFTVYESEKESTESVENHQYHARKGFELILIPDKPGDLKVPLVGIPYFNPYTETYETASIPEMPIRVLGDMPFENGASGNTGGGFDTIVINQVNYKDTDDGILLIHVKKDTLLWAAIAVVIFFIAGAAAWWTLTRRAKKNPELQALGKKIKSSNDVHEIFNLFNSMMKLCYQVNLKANSRSSVQDSLADTDLCERVLDIMDYVESFEMQNEKGHMILKEKIKNCRVAPPR